MTLETKIFSLLQLDLAALLLQQGELLAFPTETVYGLGASIFNPEAIEKIFKVKGRPADNPLIAHLSDLSQAEKIAIDIPSLFFTLAEHFFPGPLTVVLKRHPDVPPIVSSGLPTIALRMPSHPVAHQLIKLAGVPVVAPSANLSGKPSSTCVSHVLEDFKGKIAGVIDAGSSEIGIESTVISLFGEGRVALLRPGSISKEAIEEVLKRPVETVSDSIGIAHSPGMKYRHYSPLAKVRVFLNEEHFFQEWKNPKNRKKRMVLSRSALSKLDHFSLSSKDLYAHLRRADQEGFSEVWILCDLEIQANLGLMNRILRASDCQLISL